MSSVVPPTLHCSVVQVFFNESNELFIAPVQQQADCELMHGMNDEASVYCSHLWVTAAIARIAELVKFVVYMQIPRHRARTKYLKHMKRPNPVANE